MCYLRLTALHYLKIIYFPCFVFFFLIPLFLGESIVKGKMNEMEIMTKYA